MAPASLVPYTPFQKGYKVIGDAEFSWKGKMDVSSRHSVEVGLLNVYEGQDDFLGEIGGLARRGRVLAKE